MAPGDATLPSDQREILKQILSTVQSVQADYQNLSTAVASVQRQVNILSEFNRVHNTTDSHPSQTSVASTAPPSTGNQWVAVDSERSPNVQVSSLDMRSTGHSEARSDGESHYGRKHSATATSRIILTTYPGQSGIDPLVINWGHPDALKRGPVVVSRNQSTIRRRNAIGAHGGSYSIYHALAVASKHLDADHKPDFTNSEPAVNIGPFPQWTRIVSIDPLGHLSPWLFSDMIRDENIHIRPSIAITKAHMRLPELEQSVRDGRIVPDEKICLNEFGELAVTKFAVEPVWHLPGVAERFGIAYVETNPMPDEGALRRSLFENTGGSFPELITRGDIKLFLPPIGGLTVYCFGDPARMADPNVKLALRVHDECNGSDVFGSDICTCRPYLIFGVEEAVKEAQKGGSGVVIYFRKEGRALGEVTKYLVYNARKRGADRASEYFQRTENIAGVKDMRFQALMPDILHWLGITKIDRMLSMSNMKYDAIVDEGIPIHERVPIPDELIPEDSRVEIDAKLYAGYFTNGEVPSIEALSQVHGRAWDDVDH